MEAYVKEEDIKDAVTYMSSVLSSLTFNRTVLETLIGNNIIDYKEETYDVMKPKGNNVTQDTYLDYVERYDNYEEYVELQKFNDESAFNDSEIKELTHISLFKRMFRVGDKVRIHKPKNINEWSTWTSDMYAFDNKIGTVTAVSPF